MNATPVPGGEDSRISIHEHPQLHNCLGTSLNKARKETVFKNWKEKSQEQETLVISEAEAGGKGWGVRHVTSLTGHLVFLHLTLYPTVRNCLSLEVNSEKIKPQAT